MPAKYTPEKRARVFAQRVDKSTSLTGCWLWTGATVRGYGVVNWDGKVTLVHRMVWEQENGRPVPDGLFVCHSCDTPACVNPDHLWAGTQTDNMRDMSAKGRTGHSPIKARGEKAGNVRLTEIQAAEIFSMKNRERQVDLAARFGVCPSTIWSIMSGRTWRHVTGDL